MYNTYTIKRSDILLSEHGKRSPPGGRRFGFLRNVFRIYSCFEISGTWKKIFFIHNFFCQACFYYSG